MTKDKALARSLIAMICAVQGCSWTRFDDVTDHPPVELLETPDGIAALGLSMATFPTALGTTLAVAGTDHLVTYELGTGADPSRTAASSQSCAGDSSCIFARHLAGLKDQPSFSPKGCVAYGLGTAPGQTFGKLWLYCEGGQRHSLDLSTTPTEWLATGVVDAQTVVEIATTQHGEFQPLVASLPDAAAIWFYDGTSMTPIELPSLPDNQVAGRALAIIPYNSEFVIAASSVSTPNEVWLYRIDVKASVTLIGRIQGPPEFGRLLATGQFDADAIDDLIVADATEVHIIAGSSFVALPDNIAPPVTTFDKSTAIANVSCSTLTDLNGCSGQVFASAVAAANLDGVGSDELVVGAADTVVRGENAAGAVFVYAQENGNLVAKDGLFVSSASAGDRLGSSLAIAPVASVDAIVAGAPGANSVMAFYCNSLMPAASKSARCP